MGNNVTASDYKWQSSYRKLIKLRSMYPKDCYNEVLNGRPNPVYSWCLAQRRNRFKLSPKHLFQLEQLNFPWDSENKVNSDKWDVCFEQLVDHKMIYKENWLDEKIDDEFNPLYDWIEIQRNEKRKLAKSKIERLNSIGFNWNNAAEEKLAKWTKELNFYKKYMEQYSNKDHPFPKIRKNSKLERWCDIQRENRAELTEEQIEQLEELGFEWRSATEVRNETWDLCYDELLEYARTHNNKLPSDNTEDPHLRHIKFWYKYQITIKELLTEEQLEKLSVIENRRKKKEQDVDLKIEF